MHYNLDAGLLRTGDDADFIMIGNFWDFNILATYVKGNLIYENGITFIGHLAVSPENIFVAELITSEDLWIKPTGNSIRVIEAFDGELVTGELIQKINENVENLVSDIENDILKIVVINRYEKSKPAIGFIKNFGLKTGAIASSVAHDSHNIIAVGTNDDLITKAVNAVIKTKGGLSVVSENSNNFMPLPIAGIMTDMEGYKAAELYGKLNEKVKSLGCKLNAPFMTLSFMALLVIPALKLSDKGLFDGRTFQFTELFLTQ